MRCAAELATSARQPGTEADGHGFGPEPEWRYFLARAASPRRLRRQLDGKRHCRVPIRSGIGLRLGADVVYLKFTPQSTWNYSNRGRPPRHSNGAGPVPVTLGCVAGEACLERQFY
jgi:hypothetical protein